MSYILNEGPDRAQFRIHIPDEERKPIDKIEEFWNGRYLSAMEATWCILGFNMCRKDPLVTSLPVHLPGSLHHTQYQMNASAPSISKLLHYFSHLSGSFSINGINHSFDTLLYVDYFSLFHLQTYNIQNNDHPNFYREHSTQNNDQTPMHVILCQSQNRHIARIQSVHLSQCELFYIRALLQNRPALSFNDLHTIDNVIHKTFQAAYIALSIFTNKNKADYCLNEAIHTLKTTRQIHLLFIHMLTNKCIDLPLCVWTKFLPNFIANFMLDNDEDLHLSTNLALQDLARYLEEYGKCLTDFSLPQPISPTSELTHEYQRWQRLMPHLLEQALQASESFNYKQHLIAQQITHALSLNLPLLIFIDGKVGRGKTFLVNVLCNWVQGHGLIVLPTATSAFAAQMYPGGQTTHSTFKVCITFT
jgi:PIF1-like helicase